MENNGEIVVNLRNSMTEEGEELQEKRIVSSWPNDYIAAIFRLLFLKCDWLNYSTFLFSFTDKGMMGQNFYRVSKCNEIANLFLKNPVVQLKEQCAIGYFFKLET